MDLNFKAKAWWPAVLVLFAVLGAQIGSQAASDAVKPATTTKPARKILIHFSKSEGDTALHSALMGLGIATGLAKMGAKVTVMLDSEAPQLAKISWSGKALVTPGHDGQPAMKSRTLGETIADFTRAGGRIVMCPHCSMVCGITSANVPPGVRLAAEGELAKIVFAADKILDY